MINKENTLYFSPYSNNTSNTYTVEAFGDQPKSDSKYYFEFQFIVPAVAYHTSSTVEYTHSAYKVGFIQFLREDLHRVRDRGPHTNPWVEFGYIDSLGYCISSYFGCDTDNQPILNYAIPFDDPNTDVFTHKDDILGLEFDVQNGRLDNIYINGVQHTISDPDLTVVTQWTPGTTIQPYALMVNLPYVSAGASYTDISPFQEMCALRLNCGSAEFRYGPSAGYLDWAHNSQNEYYATSPYTKVIDRLTISDTATATLSNTLTVHGEKWYTVRWEDSGDVDAETIFGELVLDFTGSDTLADVAIFEYTDRYGCPLWDSRWNRDNLVPTGNFRLLNKKTYFMCIGFDLYCFRIGSGETDGKWAESYALSAGAHELTLTVTPL